MYVWDSFPDGIIVVDAPHARRYGPHPRNETVAFIIQK
jgi:hypothetical protein